MVTTDESKDLRTRRHQYQPRGCTNAREACAQGPLRRRFLARRRDSPTSVIQMSLLWSLASRRARRLTSRWHMD